MVDNIYNEIRDIKMYALDNNVPIMVDAGIDFLTTFVIKEKIKSVLEIGTAIGYSAIMMALANLDLKIVSIERDKVRYLEALKNVKKFKLEDRITLIFNDAKEVNFDVKSNKFDLLFIDAAKSQNKCFFELFERNIIKGGFVITDNMNFHGYVLKNDEDIKSSNIRGLVHKIRDYKAFLESLNNYNTSFYDIGDGIAVSQKVRL